MSDHISEILIKHYQYLKLDSDSFKEYFLFQIVHITYSKNCSNIMRNKKLYSIQLYVKIQLRETISQHVIYPSIVITRPHHKISNQIQTDPN